MNNELKIIHIIRMRKSSHCLDHFEKCAGIIDCFKIYKTSYLILVEVVYSAFPYIDRMIPEVCPSILFGYHNNTNKQIFLHF